MKNLLLYIYISLAALLCVLPAQAQGGEEAAQAADSVQLQISLLTCSPGSEVYQLYGHTALRVRAGREGMMNDWVFNYGTFSFQQPHFMSRFVSGQTDYELGVTPYNLFYNEYAAEGRGIYEQRLNLTADEARRLEEALALNVQPENAVYRYNFFYDNCVTRAVQMIEKCVDGEIIWPNLGKDSLLTLRDIVHEYSAVSPWNKFGQDLAIGCEADKPAPLAVQMFAPMYAMRFVSQAKIKGNDGTVRPLVAKEITLLLPAPAQDNANAVTPFWAFGTLLAFALVLTVCELKKRKYYWPFDALLLFVQGLAGCIVTYLFFFSEHPTVGSNWLVLFLNPLPLLYLPWFMRNAVRRLPATGLYAQAALLTAIVIVGIVGLQKFPLEVYLIVATLALRTAAHFKLLGNLKKK